jgi:hypothetical protein
MPVYPGALGVQILISSYRDSMRLLITFASERTAKRPNQLSIEDLDRDMVLLFFGIKAFPLDYRPCTNHR